MKDNEKTYEAICRLVGKLVIDYSFDMDKLNKHVLSLMEKISEQEKRIRELENGLVGSREDNK